MDINRLVKVALVLGMTVSVSGCSKKAVAVSEAPTATPTATPTPDPYAAPSGTYFSETTGLPISQSLKDQRPIAVMNRDLPVIIPDLVPRESRILMRFCSRN